MSGYNIGSNFAGTHFNYGSSTFYVEYSIDELLYNCMNYTN